MKLKNLLRKWLGITDEMADVWLCINQLQAETAPKPDHGGVVTADQKMHAWEPNQTGNVVVVEPKIASMMRDV